ncbi:helix-turn-helix transcriptional regulator [uncultured Brevundimonas sp.]|uniref:helix-turn-helix domain-containing protein n=1 Tax=uncultured Brevundimonas sp. TaxID=213418 RepID=UPI0030ED262F|tara:strand:- start:15486 stop:15725 length:240 start_codon:yes stop_codon:yes gene_type:complete
MAVTPEACRAGRAILKWSMRDLAEHSGVAWTTINRLEAGAGARDATAAKILAAFEARGVELLHTDHRTGATVSLLPDRS